MFFRRLEVVILRRGKVFEYQGGCEHPVYGWVFNLKGCDLEIAEGTFKQHFKIK